ncbi:type 1 fimbrial protein [Stenotrophomonas indicatrix]|uniref:fimbrial protein n=1 Tax=Stenotrophomonas indicatrix TaxID=2045451 RepID=UPI0028ECD6C0|nr:type 1 fimbrial protein [Stenotrophomonas indicatrix]MDT9583074.1 type 1 fimbrial protein [Stenotrophomonas indicatrix]
MNYDRVHANYPSDPMRYLDAHNGIVVYSGCTVGSFEASIRLDMPGLHRVGDITYDGMVLPAYEATPDSALIAFIYQRVVGWPRQPLKPGETVHYPIDLTGTADPVFNLRAYFFSRGGRMRTFETMGSAQIDVASYPHLDLNLPLRIRMTFPAVTCPLLDSNEALQDVPAAELSVPGSTAREKLVALRMDCGMEAPRARIAITDAGDAGNTGSQLTPTADSDAEGVRVQLLRNGTEVQFGQVWDFDPGTGGAHDHEFGARYIRTSESLLPGMIKGEAILNVDYW